ncbi:MAG TPA: hypothetical protein VE090_03035 [Methylomirabilota bacterium]|nr:hypothetical protein [Methylomirabilota bacterium]
MIDERFVIVGVLLNAIGGAKYLFDTLKGKTKPNKVTWFLWALAPLIAFAAEFKQGIGLISLMTFSVGFVPLIIFLASFVNRQAAWKITRLDIACGILSLLGLLLWFVTKLGNTAIFFAIISDAIAAIPTLIKSYKAPETESKQAYLLSGLNGLITTLTIKQWTFAYYGFPVYMIVSNWIIFAIIHCKIGKYFKNNVLK